MSTMTQTRKHLLYLMACALQGTSAQEEILADADLKQLLIMAKKHSVSSMVCMALEKTAIFANADETTKKQLKFLLEYLSINGEKKTFKYIKDNKKTVEFLNFN